MEATEASRKGHTVDIDEAIRQMNEHAATAAAFNDHTDPHHIAETAREMAETWQAINGWFERGGFQPQAWQG